MTQLFILLMAPPQEGQNPLMAFLPLLLIIVVFYFFMIRPQMKRQKELRNFRSQLQKGDKIITTGGIYGKVAEIHDQYVIMEVEDKMRLKVDKNAVVKDPADLAAQK